MTASRDRLRELELARRQLGQAQLSQDASLQQEARPMFRDALEAVEAAGDLGGAA